MGGVADSLRTLDEDELLARLREGDDDAYEQLVRQNGGRMLAAAGWGPVS